MGMLGKKEIRAEVKKRRREADEETLHEKSLQILERFRQLSAYKDASLLLAYVDAKREVETRLLMRCAWDDGKKVAVPRVDGDGIMHFYYLRSLKDLEPGAFGIMEPRIDCRICEPEEGLLLMPGVAFDEQGHRVGYGGGYYDRYLQDAEFKKAALCWEKLMLDQIHADGYDICMDWIISDGKR